ncbi:hypothetical protein SOASR030_37190 [Leminorella grimontii]|uniref:Phage protein GP46 n=1 Tax=Leminorella grimontii TaxID=82981 RepID=A0AAV5N736_9GAMM|nr:phage GP46 family protein [Leminorella grimontii]KFC92442.1 gp46 family phage protein [Leminorella grimontii ATCC 33999 = DSM 5078]GKX57607.1 hypothetical protein SOASR030_37190 [Leminorella grimontii]VFS55825.1 Phage protein GP46 [Leminorella grimontii]
MISLVWQTLVADIVLDSLTGDNITTNVIASLFTDRRAQPSDELPDGGTDRRGWWGDAYRKERLGSRLWLLSREKQMQTVLSKAQSYASEALAWMPKTGLIRDYRVTATNPSGGVLLLTVIILLNDGSQFPMSFKASLNGV